MPIELEVVVYGYNTVGFSLARGKPTCPPSINFKYQSSSENLKLDEADGLIIFQGAFERFEKKRGRLGVFTKVTYDHQRLIAARENCVIMLIVTDGSVFLLGKYSIRSPTSMKLGVLRDGPRFLANRAVVFE